MIPLRMQITGTEKVEGILSRIKDMLPGIVEDYAKTIKSLVEGRTTYRTGRARRSWSAISSSTTAAQQSISFQNTCSYIDILDQGLYPGVGPNTVRVGDGIFSKGTVDSKGAGIIDPIIDDDQLLQGILDVMVKIINERLE